jgi:hypothetical protein
MNLKKEKYKKNIPKPITSYKQHMKAPNLFGIRNKIFRLKVGHYMTQVKKCSSLDLI